MSGPDGAEPGDREPDVSLLVAVPGLARIAFSAWWRTAGWSFDASARAGTRVLRAAAAGESPAELFEELGAELREYLRRLVSAVETGAGGEAPAERPGSRRNGDFASLRERGADLLERSADVREEDDVHPAYEAILDQLAPDEGRILRLFALEGPQAAVDVRTAGPLRVGVGSELVAPGLNLIAREAGCRHGERVTSYLDNLNRLGLIWFSREALDDQAAYQVLEVQPEVTEAFARAGRARTVRRSIHLTAFGEGFCQACLPLHTAELDALPGDVGLASPEAQPSAAKRRSSSRRSAPSSTSSSARR